MRLLWYSNILFMQVRLLQKTIPRTGPQVTSKSEVNSTARLKQLSRRTLKYSAAARLVRKGRLTNDAYRPRPGKINLTTSPTCQGREGTEGTTSAFQRPLKTTNRKNTELSAAKDVKLNSFKVCQAH